jgi:hypothetical protein
MDIERVVHFLKGLQAQSAKGLVEWVETNPGEYSTHVKSIRVSFTTRQTDSPFDEVDYVMTFWAMPEEVFIASYTDVDLKDDLRGSYSFFKGLYDDARLSATGLKQKLDEALGAFGDPDDIPF